jgi:hypothetical protein
VKTPPNKPLQPSGVDKVLGRGRGSYLSGEFADPEIDAIALGTEMRPFADLWSEEHASDTARSLCLAHLDAELKGHVAAREFVATDLSRAFMLRGIRLDAA